MKYEVVLKRQRHANFVYRPSSWEDVCEEYHLLEAPNDEEAIAKAHELVDWASKKAARRGHILVLYAVYELHPTDNSRIRAIAVRF